jgi:cysteine desulfurase
MQRIYFDYAATTPIDPCVKKAMNAVPFGNPNSLHVFGQEAQKALDGAREKMARCLNVDFEDIVFTGSATEANNLALRGIVAGAAERMRAMHARPKIIISAIEHESVYETAKALERNGIAECALIPVNGDGIVNIRKIEKEIDERTVLVSVMYVNNETGSIQPIGEIARIIKNFRSSKSKKGLPKKTDYPLLHTDAVQALQYIDCDVTTLGVDTLTLSAHKLYGPKGVGVLYIKDRANAMRAMEPIVTGGGQEFGMRSGTQNVSGIVGCAEAAEYACGIRAKQNAKTHALRKSFFELVKEIYPRAEMNASFEACSPYILNVWFPGISNELLLIQFDKEGIAVSAGSACHARAPQASHTITAMHGEERARESIRFSFGRDTKTADIRAFGAAFRKIMERYKS